MEPQYWWLITGILLFLIEIFTPVFFAASLGIGAFAAALAAYFGASLEVQLLLFSIVSVLSIFLLRPIIKKYFYSANQVTTNADALIGKVGTVINRVDDSGLGRVAIDGDEWQFVQTTENPVLGKGEKVRVVSRESIILTVESI